MTAADEHAALEQLARLRRERPGWSIWHGRVFEARPKDSDTPRLAAGTAGELRAAIDTVEAGGAGEPSREDQDQTLAALEGQLLGLTVVPVTETPRVYASVYVGEDRELVFVEDRGGAWVYVWADGACAHPVGDPFGAARRVWLSLGRRRAER